MVPVSLEKPLRRGVVTSNGRTVFKNWTHFRHVWIDQSFNARTAVHYAWKMNFKRTLSLNSLNKGSANNVCKSNRRVGYSCRPQTCNDRGWVTDCLCTTRNAVSGRSDLDSIMKNTKSRTKFLVDNLLAQEHRENTGQALQSLRDENDFTLASTHKTSASVIPPIRHHNRRTLRHRRRYDWNCAARFCVRSETPTGKRNCPVTARRLTNGLAWIFENSDHVYGVFFQMNYTCSLSCLFRSVGRKRFIYNARGAGR